MPQGLETLASTTARTGNLWATDELLPMRGGRQRGTLVLELTSSHLAFCAQSPRIAVITSFWPDHVELHGSLEAYRRAKQNIVAHQTPSDHVVVDADDPNRYARRSRCFALQRSAPASSATAKGWGSSTTAWPRPR